MQDMAPAASKQLLQMVSAASGLAQGNNPAIRKVCARFLEWYLKLGLLTAHRR